MTNKARYHTDPVYRESQKAAVQRYWARKRAEDPQALAALLTARSRVRRERMKAAPKTTPAHAYDNEAYIDTRGA